MLIYVKTLKWVFVPFSMILIMLLIGACGTVAITPTTAPTLTATSSTSTELPISSATTVPPATVTATPTSSLPVSSAPDGLRMAYVVDGNLYLQDGSNPPFQLTHGGEDRYPSFTDDGEKIVFLRGFIPHDLYSINPDGSQEQLLVSGNELSNLGLGYDELSEVRSFAFVPSTHKLVFNTRQLDELDVTMQDWNRTASKNKDDLLVVDTDTGDIMSLFPPRQRW